MTTKPLAAFADVKALLFDVFGTVSDWRSTVTRTLHQRAQHVVTHEKTSIPDDVVARVKDMTFESWVEFAQEWRTTYYTFVRAIAADPDLPYKTVDEHNLDSLNTLLDSWHLKGLWTDEAVHDLSRIWHYLDGWADSSSGIAALNQKFTTVTLSNGTVELLSDMAQHADFPFKHIFSSNMFNSYKPNPKVYLGAAERLNLKPSECGMVAAHLVDLEAARKCGFKTIFVSRPREEAWSQEKVDQAREDGWVDLWVEGEGTEGFLTAARELGIKC